MPRHPFAVFLAVLVLATLLAQGASYEMQIGQTKRAGGGRNLLNGPSGVYVSLDRIYVADTNNHRIAIFDLQGKFIKELGRKGDSFKDMNNNSVMDDFEVGSGIDEFNFAHPQGVFASENAIYVADTGNNRIMVYDKSGKYQFQIGNLTAGADANELDVPTAVFATASAIYVADSANHRVPIYNLDGTFKGQIGVAGTAANTETTLNTPSGVLASNFLYVADTLNHRVTYYDEERKIMGMLGKGQAGSADTAFNSPRGVAGDDDRIYVADTRNNRIGVFHLTGELDEHIGGKGASGNDRLKGPVAVFAARNRVYVVDQGNHRLAIFTKGATVSYTFFALAFFLIVGTIGGGIYYFKDELDELITEVRKPAYEAVSDPYEEGEEMRQQLWE